MPVLVVSADARFLDALRRRAADALSFVDVEDAAGAMRAWAAGGIEGAVLDGVCMPTTAAEFLRWWQATPTRSGLTLIVAGRGQFQPPSQARVTDRDAGAVLTALQSVPRYVLDFRRRQLRGGGANVRLTQSEAEFLGYLVRTGRTATVDELLQHGLSHGEERTPAVLRTHVANLRRKCRDAGWPDPVETVRGVGYTAVGIVLAREADPLWVVRP